MTFHLPHFTPENSALWRSRLVRITERLLTTTGLIIVAGILSFGYGYFFLYTSPSQFPVHAIVHIPEGLTLTQAADLLADEQVIRSSSALSSIVILRRGEERVRAGDYFFDSPLTIFEVAHRILVGDYGMLPVKVTIPEGATTYEMAKLYASKLGHFDEQTFLTLAENKEGYLFPDTYYFLPNASAAQVIDTMEQNFYHRIEPLEGLIADFGKPLDEVLTMASLLEKEARTPVSRRTIAGILWNRIDANMPLQVDAVFGYIKKGDIYSPKFSDLKVDSPYNTYKYKGLPPGPIANPSLASIRAAVTPIESSYLFYLSDRGGRMHYSTAYSQHLRYKRMYLN
jgi:UPF0755 protein